MAYLRFLSADLHSINRSIAVAVQNGDQWATHRCGGYISPGAMFILASGLVLFNPKLTHEEAVATMKPMTDYVASLRNVVLNNEVNTTCFPTRRRLELALRSAVV